MNGGSNAPTTADVALDAAQTARRVLEDLQREVAELRRDVERLKQLVAALGRDPTA